jgi:hypothetical protein
VVETDQVPLLAIPERRRQYELRRAEDIARGSRRDRSRVLLLGGLCLVWWLVGVALLGLSWHLTDGDLARAALYGGLLVGNGGPWFTLVLAYWRRTND